MVGFDKGVARVRSRFVEELGARAKYISEHGEWPPEGGGELGALTVDKLKEVVWAVTNCRPLHWELAWSLLYSLYELVPNMFDAFSPSPESSTEVPSSGDAAPTDDVPLKIAGARSEPQPGMDELGRVTDPDKVKVVW